MTKDKVAYIIIGYNNIDLIKDCIDSILNQSHKGKLIIFVDNKSSDDSVEYVKSSYPQVVIIEPGENTGFARGNNIGIERALIDNKVGSVVLLNTDARLEKNWTKTILEFAYLKPRGALFQGTTLDYFDNNIIDSTHIYLARNGQATQGNWRFYYRSELGPKKVFGVNAAACLITRKFIESQPFGSEVFDETMFMYLEDVDLATRVTLLGWDSYLVPGARAYHMGSVSSGKNPGFSLYMTFRNNSAIIYKNMPIKMIFRLIPKVAGSDLETFRHLRRQGQNKASWKLVKGRFIGIVRLPLFFGKRRVMQKNIKINEDQLWKIMDKGY